MSLIITTMALVLLCAFEKSNCAAFAVRFVLAFVNPVVHSHKFIEFSAVNP